MTITIQIGNSDDKLPQKHWAAFVEAIDREVKRRQLPLHFFGGSPFTSPNQRAAWIADCPVEQIDGFKDFLTQCRRFYRQDAVSWSQSNLERI
jgi:hypothetical protein